MVQVLFDRINMIFWIYWMKFQVTNI